nr:hypothetical protein CKG001_14900 [Bdellovibrio sp. CKG001]
MTLRTTSIFALCLFLGACAFKKDGAKEPSSPTSNSDVIETVEKVSFTGELNESNVKIDFIEDEEPGLYRLEITWPEEVPAMKVSVGNTPYQILKSGNRFTMPIGYSTKTNIHLVALNALGGESSTFAAEATSPKDILISNEEYLDQDSVISANRIYLLENGRIITNGYDLSLNANKIYVTSPSLESKSRMHFRDAHILTTTPKNVATSIEFLKGSHIKIKAQKAVGHLRVAMVGFNGIDGKPGSNGTAGTVGKKGRDGDIKDFSEYCVNDDGRPCLGSSQISCTANPTNGEAGSPGSQGQDGESGSAGGNSGILTAIIDDHTQFKLEVAQRRGLGGRGGAGGKGGQGGPGGAPGDNPLNKCKSAAVGPRGTNGADGKPGPDGKAGLLDDVITNVSNFSRYEID